MSAGLGFFAAMALFHLLVFNILRRLIAHEDDVPFSMMDWVGWLDARSLAARRYRNLAVGWLIAGAVGVIVFAMT